MDKRLAVWLGGKRIGTLEQDQSGRMRFAYDAGASTPLSLSMAVREEPYGDDLCESFFGGLLPESVQSRQLIGKRFGVNGNNSFSLLSVIGHECAGAISIFPDSVDAPPVVTPSELKVLTEAELATHVRELPRRPLLAGVEGMRLSLAGAGDKTAVCVVDGKIALPPDGTATSHIIKPNIATIGDTVSNEFFSMRLAKRVGLSVADVEMRSAEGVRFLLVKRYDRLDSGNGQLTRIHQEDFCQALGVVSARKYQNEGGPGFKDCFDLLRRVARPAVDRTRMTSYVIFNFLLGNMDAHGKNFSLVHQPNLALSPLYDVLSTAVYSDLSSKMAMKVDNHYEPDDIFPRHWKRLCEAGGLAYPAFKRSFLEMCNQLPGSAEALRDELASSFPTETFDAIVQYVNESTGKALKRFAKERE